ncbi:hypothetical protein QJQ45_012229 [Haematococcus lacustris]|nr:hypothetical protein QJQ45_012229 [Haematococcus lacustris]
MKKRMSKAHSAQLNALNNSLRAGYLLCPNNIKAAACTAQATNRDLQAEVQRLRDVEQSLMGTVDGLQGDLDDLQAAHQRLQEAGYGRLDSHGQPMGSKAEQLSPAGLAPSPTDIFTSTEEAPVGRPAARSAPYNAHHCLSTVRLHLETGVSRRALSKCRQCSERCVLPNPHRPGKTSTVGREFHIVSTYMQRKTLGTTPEVAVPAGAPPQRQQQLAVASTSRKREAPAANKLRAAKQGATDNSVAKRASVARLACGEIA